MVRGEGRGMSLKFSKEDKYLKASPKRQALLGASVAMSFVKSTWGPTEGGTLS